MELQWKKEEIACLKPMLREVQEQEQTQEVRLPEDMPEVGRILGAWGQPVMRSKQWQGTSAELSGGMLVWVLYMSETGEEPRQVESWIPFRIRWDLPENCSDGTLRMLILPRFVDARPISAGKLMIRVGVTALAEAWCPDSASLYQPEQVPEGVELLHRSWPVRLPREAGEKAFQLEQTLELPSSAPRPRRILYHQLTLVISDRKVLANKTVFRGSGKVHMLYASEDGQLHSWDFEVPFSQFSELEGQYTPDAQVDMIPMVTNVELSLDPEDRLQLNAGVTVQYLVDDRQMLELTEDAYSPEREMELHRQNLELPVLLDSRRENLYGEQTVPGSADLVVDSLFQPEFPRVIRNGEEIKVEQPGMMQVLYYDASGQLQCASHRWMGNHSMNAAENADLMAMPMPAGEPQVLPGAEEMTIRQEAPVQLTAVSREGLPMVTGVRLGDIREKDPQRPSLILRRASREGLWEIAKTSGSTVESIRSANGLQSDPEPGKMLLIPVL